MPEDFMKCVKDLLPHEDRDLISHEDIPWLVENRAKRTNGASFPGKFTKHSVEAIEKHCTNPEHLPAFFENTFDSDYKNQFATYIRRASMGINNGRSRAFTITRHGVVRIRTITECSNKGGRFAIGYQKWDGLPGTCQQDMLPIFYITDVHELIEERKIQASTKVEDTPKVLDLHKLEEYCCTDWKDTLNLRAELRKQINEHERQFVQQNISERLTELKPGEVTTVCNPTTVSELLAKHSDEMFETAVSEDNPWRQHFQIKCSNNSTLGSIEMKKILESKTIVLGNEVETLNVGAVIDLNRQLNKEEAALEGLEGAKKFVEARKKEISEARDILMKRLDELA